MSDRYGDVIERCDVCDEPLNDDGVCPNVQEIVDAAEDLHARSTLENRLSQ